MTRARPDEPEQAQLSLLCGHCDAQPGDWCRTRSGAFYNYLHAARFYQATALRLMPWHQALREASGRD